MNDKTFLVLDLETTGLDPKADKIIEIGAVLHTKNGKQAEYSQLVNPGIPIPRFITELTGITREMVQSDKALPVQDALEEFRAFLSKELNQSSHPANIKDLPVTGHNVGFDLSFLREEGALKDNPAIDTYDLASVILPGEGRYNLRALGQVLGVPKRATHRALDDTLVTLAIFKIMYEKILQLPLPTLIEIIRLAEDIPWKGTLPFLWALEERKKGESGSRRGYLSQQGDDGRERGCFRLLFRRNIRSRNYRQV